MLQFPRLDRPKPLLAAQNEVLVSSTDTTRKARRSLSHGDEPMDILRAKLEAHQDRPSARHKPARLLTNLFDARGTYAYASLPTTPLPPASPDTPEEKPTCAASEPPPFSLWDYLWEEIAATDFDSHQEMKWERVSNFLSVPLAIEKVRCVLHSNLSEEHRHTKYSLSVLDIFSVLTPSSIISRYLRSGLYWHSGGQLEISSDLHGWLSSFEYGTSANLKHSPTQTTATTLPKG